MAQESTFSEPVESTSWLVKARARAWVNADLPAWLFAAWAALLVLRAHLPYVLEPMEQSLDEGYVLAIGQRMLHGRWLPYVEGAAHTGPVFLYSGALLAALGEFSWLPTRIVAALGFTLMPVLTFACARRAGHPFAGAIAAVGTPLYVTLRMTSVDAYAYNAELPAVVFMLASLYAGMRSFMGEPRRPSLGWMISAGVFAALAALSKQIAATIVLPVMAYLLVHLYVRTDLDRRERVRLIVAFLAALFAVVLLVFGRLALGNALSDAYYYLVTYNKYPYMDPFRGQSLREAYKLWLQQRPYEMSLTLGVLTWGCAQIYVAWVQERTWLRTLHSSSFDWLATGLAIGGLIGARASRREYDHYYVMLVPGFGLLLGLFLERAMGNLRRAQAAYQVMMFAPLLLIGELALSWRNDHLVGWSKQENRLTNLISARQDPPLCKYIRAHSKPTDRLFVWGFRPQIHVSCARVPASRYVFSTMVSGFVPWFEGNNHLQDVQYVVPGSQEVLARELAETKPPVIVEASRSMGNRMMRNAGPAWDYVEANYHRDKVIDGDVVYLRNDLVTARSR